MICEGIAAVCTCSCAEIKVYERVVWCGLNLLHDINCNNELRVINNGLRVIKDSHVSEISNDCEMSCYDCCTVVDAEGLICTVADVEGLICTVADVEGLICTVADAEGLMLIVTSYNFCLGIWRQTYIQMSE